MASWRIFAMMLFLYLVSCSQPKKQPNMYSISGTVVNAQEQPVEGAIVMIVDGTSPFTDLAAVTNPDGVFRLGNVAEGEYTIQASVGEKKYQTTIQVNGPNTTARIRTE